jgi:hypothetical protein
MSDDDDDDDNNNNNNNNKNNNNNNNAMKVHRKHGDKFPHTLDFGIRWR